MSEDILQEYKFLDGQWTFRDSEMLWVYDHIEKRDEIFYNVDQAHFRSNGSWDALMYWKTCRTWLGFHNEKLTGILWVSSFNRPNKSGFFNFATVDTSDITPQAKVHLATEGVRRIIDMDDFNVLYAETSVCRNVALAMADYIGFVKLGVIPKAHYHKLEDKFYDTVFMYITKETVRRN